MFRIIFILSAFFLSCHTGQSTKEVIDPDLGYKTNYTINSKDQSYDGPYTKVDSAGVLLEKGNYDSGKLEGIRELFFPDGKVKVRERYRKGQIADLYEYYFPNGQLQLQGQYIDGAMYGIWRKYNEDGKLLEEVMMVQNEELGPFTEYYPDGTLQTQGTYLHGPNEDGLLNLYDESGQLYKTMVCDSGICITTWEKK